MSIQRDVLEAGVLFVGGGAASLTGAIHLAQLIHKHNEEVASGKKQGEAIDLEASPIFVVEKAENLGDHSLSGAVMNPTVMNELFPDWKKKGAPLTQPVCGDSVLYLTEGGKSFRFPITPPTFHNQGNYIVSLGRVNKWLAEQAEALGVMVLSGFPAYEALYDENNRVYGVRIGDKGIDKGGSRKPNFEAGAEIHAKVTAFGDGVRGNITKHLIPKLGLDKGRNPQVYSTGVKELWEVPAGRLLGGRVTHTMGFPLDFSQFGGSFIYEVDDRHIAIGMVVSLDGKDPHLDPHLKLQQLKTHPTIRKMIEGGKMVSYGAKTIPEGGWYSVPQLFFEGGVLIGDSAGLVNVPSLKGIHYAMKSGYLAAETMFKSMLSNDYSAKALSSYGTAVEESFIGQDLKKWAKFRQGFSNGLIAGSINAGLLQGLGWSPIPKTITEDYKHMARVKDYYKEGVKREEVKFDGVTTFNKLDDVYHSGTTHEEDQPCHLVISDYNICNTRCTEEFGNPCESFCPAAVYEMVPNEDGKGKHLYVNFSNCVHCKTCDIRDPYQIINWVTPEGGDGPKYKDL